MSKLKNFAVTLSVIAMSAFIALAVVYAQDPSVFWFWKAENCNWKFAATENHSAAQTDNELVAAPAAGLSLYLTDVTLSVGGTAGSIKLVEDTTSAVDIYEEAYFAANGGLVAHFETPIKLTAAKNLGFTSTTVVGHSVSVQGCVR